MSDDLGKMVEQDIERFQNVSTGTAGIAAWIEVGFAALTIIAAIIWLVAMFWVPEAIAGTTWLSLGLVGIGMFGVPFLALFWLRRGGARVVRQLTREALR